MDQQAIRDAAIQLESVLRSYALTNETASALLKSLKPVLDQATAGQVLQSVDPQSIPGGRTFEETDARDLPGLGHAYARFVIEMSGGESLGQRRFRERHGLAR